MACSPTPTATLFGTDMDESVTTLYSEVVSDLPNTVATILVETCMTPMTAISGSTMCASTNTVEEVTTILGGQTTFRVPFVTTIQTTREFPTETLFASCTSKPLTIHTHTALQDISYTPSSDQGPSNSMPDRVPSHRTTTLSDGSVVFTTIYVTSSAAPSIVYVSSGGPQVQGTAGRRTGDKVGPIVGGAVAGSLSLIGIVIFIWYIIWRRAAKDVSDISGEVPAVIRSKKPSQDHNSRKSLDMTSELDPKPYQYGLVGVGNKTPSLSPSISFMSAPGSPTQEYTERGRRRSYSPEVDYTYGHRSLPSQDHTLSPRTSMSGHGHGYQLDYTYDTQPSQPQTAHHQRRPSRSSLLHAGGRMDASLERSPTAASLYSAGSLNFRPGYSRDGHRSRRRSHNGPGPSRPSTGGSVASRPSTGNSQTPMLATRPSTGNSQTHVLSTRPSTANSQTHMLSTRPSTGNSQTHMILTRPSTGNSQTYMLPTRPRQTSATTYTTLDLPDEFGLPLSPQRPLSTPEFDQVINANMPVSRHTLTLTNWNPSTDAISLDLDGPSAPVVARVDSPCSTLDEVTNSSHLARVTEGLVANPDGGTANGDGNGLDPALTQKPPPAYLN